MKQQNHYPSTALEARFGRQVALRLSDAANALPHDISERLRVARQQALARHAQAETAATASRNGSATLTLGGGFGPWRFAASLMPLMMLIAGLVALNLLISDDRARELADIDAAILTDDLPPAAYADPGFAQYLKTSQRESAQ